MQNKIQEYAWGSKSYIQNLLSLQVDTPMAELWMGSHPKASSQILINGMWTRLSTYLSDTPITDATLPYLLKVLAADLPLSIQAHPSKAQAQIGFSRENDLGIPLDSPVRNYKDDNHKPELICALTPFSAMCGFRQYQEIIDHFTALKFDRFFSTFPVFRSAPSAQTFRAFFHELMTLPEYFVTNLMKDLDSMLSTPHLLPSSMDSITRCCSRIKEEFSQDIGILAPLYLNLIDLKPHQALYLDAGILHAYLQGAGMEIMANSDNVLRGGLTPKHIDIDELLDTISFEPWTVEILEPFEQSPSLYSYPTPAQEFYLMYYSGSDGSESILDSVRHDCIVFCADGSAAIHCCDTQMTIERGQSIFVPATDLPISIRGKAELYIATSL
jgi:mannose-6-phosphate isomerase